MSSLTELSTVSTLPSGHVESLKSLKLAASHEEVDQEYRKTFLAELPDLGLRALWHNEMRTFTGLPNSDCVPHRWSYETAREVILRAAGATTTAEAERRALLMINPGMKRAPYTTDTILAAWQLLLPGEKALCHRHTVFAIRFFIEGSKGYTAVGGKKMYMEPGDLILTTQFNWHDHGNDGDDPCIWLDGLDQPLFEGNFPLNFQMRFMNHPDSVGARYHASEVATGADAPGQYKWKDMKARLDAAAGTSARLEYQVESMPEKHISRTIAAYAIRINAESTTSPLHDTCNNIFHAISGAGYSTIQDRETGAESRMQWKKGDTWVIPAWYHFTHSATDGSAYVFNYTDFPTIEKLGFYHSAL